MNVKQFSQKTGLSSHTLRYYEKIGLFLEVKRDARGYRYYSQDDVEWVEHLKAFKSMGMSLADMKYCVSLRKQGDSTIDDRIKAFEKHYEKLQVELEKLQQDLAHTQCRIFWCKKKRALKLKIPN